MARRSRAHRDHGSVLSMIPCSRVSLSRCCSPNPQPMIAAVPHWEGRGIPRPSVPTAHRARLRRLRPSLAPLAAGSGLEPVRLRLRVAAAFGRARDLRNRHNAEDLVQLPDGRIAVGGGTIVVSADDGATWTSICAALPYPPSGVGLRPCCAEAFYIWEFDSLQLLDRQSHPARRDHAPRLPRRLRRAASRSRCVETSVVGRPAPCGVLAVTGSPSTSAA